MSIEIQNILIIAGLLIFSYLLGAIPTAYLICKKVAKVDIRECGSGNVGANNTKRILGTGPAIIVLVFDILKGVIPVAIAKIIEWKLHLYADISLLPALAAFAAVLGHTKSIFLNFKGGKGAATGAGTLFILYWPVALIITALVVILSLITKFRALGIYVVVPLSALLMWLFDQPASYVIYCISITLLMLYLFRTNLQKYIKTGESR
jgi:glycerol-3-phosphate acyltransferase PlsY